MSMLRSYPCLCVDDVERSVAFYSSLAALEVSADVGWYVELGRPGTPDALLAVVERGHSSVPAGFDTQRGGVLVSLIVEDVDRVVDRTGGLGCPVVQECRDEEFGQRHVVVVDPDGFLVDVIQPIRPSLAFRRALVAGRRRRRA